MLVLVQARELALALDHVFAPADNAEASITTITSATTVISKTMRLIEATSLSTGGFLTKPLRTVFFYYERFWEVLVWTSGPLLWTR